MKYKFTKEERLNSEKAIKELFDKGSSFFLHPFKTLHTATPEEPVNKVLISVSKRKIKKAVDRNLIKRRIKEAYRLHKHLLESQNLGKVSIAFIYIASDILPYQVIEEKLILSLDRLVIDLKSKVS